MSDLHCRGCLCDECCPGTKAKATRVYRFEHDRGCTCRPCQERKGGEASGAVMQEKWARFWGVAT